MVQSPRCVSIIPVPITRMARMDVSQTKSLQCNLCMSRTRRATDLMLILSRMGSSARRPDQCADLSSEERLGTPVWHVCRCYQGGCAPVTVSGWQVVLIPWEIHAPLCLPEVSCFLAVLRPCALHTDEAVTVSQNKRSYRPSHKSGGSGQAGSKDLQCRRKCWLQCQHRSTKVYVLKVANGGRLLQTCNIMVITFLFCSLVCLCALRLHSVCHS
jgi:hypothetical protein